MRKILPNIRVLELKAENAWVVATQNAYFSVAADTASLIQLLCEYPAEGAEFYARKLAAKTGYDITADEISVALESLPDELFSHAEEKKPRYSLSLFQGKRLDSLTDYCKHLFDKRIATCILMLAVLSTGISLFIGQAQPASHLLTAAVVLCSILFHEIGHASACTAVGARPSTVGIGIKHIVPTFYTDVSDVWTRGKRARMLVDVGGIYFQLIFAGAVGALSLLIPGLRASFLLILSLIVFSSLPYYRFDGYWLLLDWLGEENLRKWFKNSIEELREKFSARKLGSKDAARGMLIISYFAGLVLLNIWGLVLIYRLAVFLFGKFDPEGFHAFVQHALHDYILSREAAVAVLLAIAAAFLFKRFKRYAVDGFLIAKFCLVLFGLRLAGPFMHLRDKHKKYIRGVQNGLSRSNLGLGNTKRIANRAVVGKYYELFWFDLLSKLSTEAGLWLVRKTHRTVSRSTFESVADDNVPTILIAPHFGSFLSGALFLLDRIPKSRPVHIFYADPKTDPDNARYQGFYSRYFPNVSICFDNRAGVLQAAKALRNGEIVVIMPDVFSGANLVDISLLGNQIGVRPGISYFNQKFGARLIPVLSTFDAFLGVNVHIEPAVSLSNQSGESHNNEQHVMQTIFKDLEAWIFRHPDHWHCWERFNAFAKQPLMVD